MMSIQREPDGRRSVRVETEVPGTPEQVWQAIASGPGISAWFVPTTVDGRVGGELVSDFGGGMLSTAKVTDWQPPVRFCAESQGWAPGMPTVATEWTVEALAGGTCRVRVVHSLFADTDDWDGQLTGTESGWPSYFRVLRRYLVAFAGQAVAQVQAMAMSERPIADVWSELCAAMRIGKPAPGQRFRVAIGLGVTFRGEVDRVDAQGAGGSVLANLTEPLPGTLFVGTFPCGGTMVSLQAFLYGERAAKVAAGARPVVQQWLGATFPPPATAEGGS